MLKFNDKVGNENYSTKNINPSLDGIEDKPLKNYSIEDTESDILNDEYPSVDNPNDNFFNEDLNDNLFNDGGGVAPIEKHNDLLKELTNFAPFLRSTVNNWLGIQWSEVDEKFVPNKNIKPIMNIHGANWCVGRLQIYARPNNIITDISSTDYQFLHEDIIEEVWINIGTRSEEFGIRNEGDILRVANELIHASTLVLMGAGDGRYNKFLGTSINRHENISADPAQQMYPMPGMNQRKPTFVNKLSKFFTGS